ncbi:MAG TPA: nitronate monooxygenase, partial [Acidimicrobiales bacterium]|nr:nitronate monooxygenase [Acidimicrobiales bacterium]
MRDLLRVPVVVAPMAGGPTTTALVVAAAEAGGLGFLAAGYKSASAMEEDVAAVRDRTAEAFGVNVFVPGRPSDPAVVDAYLTELAADVEALGAALGDPVWDDDAYEEKIDALVRLAPPAVSFTFGLPDAEVVDALHRAGSQVVLTVTTAEEARLADALGPDALCLQGIEAGAHRGSFTNDDRPGGDVGLLSLVHEVTAATATPVIAAGGIAGPRQVRAAMALGASAVQCGTAFLCCPESGASALHKAALADPAFTTTALTRAFSGRPARGLVNRFMTAHQK